MSALASQWHEADQLLSARYFRFAIKSVIPMPSEAPWKRPLSRLPFQVTVILTRVTVILTWE